MTNPATPASTSFWKTAARRFIQNLLPDIGHELPAYSQLFGKTNDTLINVKG